MTLTVADPVARAPLEPLLTNEDLERLLRVDRRTVARLCRRGHLPKPLKLGGGLRWRPEDVAGAIDALAAAKAREGGREEELAAAV